MIKTNRVRGPDFPKWREKEVFWPIDPEYIRGLFLSKRKQVVVSNITQQRLLVDDVSFETRTNFVTANREMFGNFCRPIYTSDMWCMCMIAKSCDFGVFQLTSSRWSLLDRASIMRGERVFFSKICLLLRISASYLNSSLCMFNANLGKVQYRICNEFLNL